jgi:hypothetical protein
VRGGNSLACRTLVHDRLSGYGWSISASCCFLSPSQCGKALNERKAEIRIQFHKPPNMLFADIHNNEIVMRIQPNEALWVKVRAGLWFGRGQTNSLAPFTVFECATLAGTSKCATLTWCLSTACSDEQQAARPGQYDRGNRAGHVI